MLRQGHRVRLFGYGKITNVPEGIEVADARDVLPFERVIFDRRTGSPALGADVFRYALMSRGLGMWLDLDVLLLRPIHTIGAHVFGWESRKKINGAVLFLLRDSPLLADLVAFTGERHPIPPFFPFRRRVRLHWSKLRGRPVPIEDMPWGVFGPAALTHFVGRHGQRQLARAPEVFYPVQYADAHAPFMASMTASVQAAMKPSTLALHLWNELLRSPSHLRPALSDGSLIVERDSFVERFARTELGFKFTSAAE